MLADFDIVAPPPIDPATLATLADGSFIDTPTAGRCCWATRAPARPTC